MKYKSNEVLRDYLIEIFNKIENKYYNDEENNFTHTDGINLLLNINYSKLNISDIISSLIFSGKTINFLYYTTLNLLQDDYIPIIFENELEGRNISKNYYMITFLKFQNN